MAEAAVTRRCQEGSAPSSASSRRGSPVGEPTRRRPAHGDLCTIPLGGIVLGVDTTHPATSTDKQQLLTPCAPHRGTGPPAAADDRRGHLLHRGAHQVARGQQALRRRSALLRDEHLQHCLAGASASATSSAPSLSSTRPTKGRRAAARAYQPCRKDLPKENSLTNCVPVPGMSC